jgi:hypothetical protein
MNKKNRLGLLVPVGMIVVSLLSLGSSVLLSTRVAGAGQTTTASYYTVTYSIQTKITLTYRAAQIFIGYTPNRSCIYSGIFTYCDSSRPPSYTVASYAGTLTGTRVTPDAYIISGTTTWSTITYSSTTNSTRSALHRDFR